MIIIEASKQDYMGQDPVHTIKLPFRGIYSIPNILIQTQTKHLVTVLTGFQTLDHDHV